MAKAVRHVKGRAEVQLNATIPRELEQKLAQYCKRRYIHRKAVAAMAVWHFLSMSDQECEAVKDAYYRWSESTDASQAAKPRSRGSTGR